MRVRIGLSRVTVAVVASMMLLSACSQSAPTNSGSAPAGKPIVIGVTLKIAPNYLDWWRDGVEFAVADINASGGINGSQVKAQIEQFEKPTDAVAAIQKLMDVDKVPIVVGTNSAGVMAQAPIVKDKNVVLINAAASAPGLRNFGGTNIFSVIPLGTDQYEAMAETAYKMNYRKLATMIERGDMGAGGNKVFQEKFKSLGGEIIGTVEHEQSSADFRSQLLKLQSLKPDAVFLVSAVADTAQILKQANQIGFKGPWLTYEVAVGQPVLDVAGKAAEGLIWAAFPYDTESGGAKTVEWAKRFKAKHNYVPNIYPAAIYDAVMIAAEALKAGSTEPTKLSATLKTLSYEGVTGPIKFDAQNMLNQPVRLMMIKDGKFTSCASCPK